MFNRTFPGMYALRYPHFSPSEGGGIDLDAEFGPEPVIEAVEPEPAPAAEPVVEEPPAEPAAEPEAETVAEAPATAEVEEEPEETPEPRKDWRDRQIIKRNKELADERAETARLKAENDALKALTTEEGKDPPVTQAEAVRIAEENIRREQYFTRINEGAEKMYEAGTKDFPKSFATRASQAADALSDEMRARPDFLEVVTGFDNAAAVYHDLAGDLDHMEAVLKMPPAKMGVELAKISARLSVAPKPAPISRTPTPIKPLERPAIEERTLEDLANDDSPAAMDAFDRRMKAIEEKKWKESQGR